METITLKAPGISCAHCEAAISSAVNKLTGVNSVTVDVSAKLVSVTYNPQELTPAEIKTAIEDQGYEVE
jgi:copper chaperone